MKKFSALSLLAACLLFSCARPVQEPVQNHGLTLSVMTFNIRLDLASDGDNAWPGRRDRVASMIHFYEPQIFGVQEALHHQLLDLAERLPRYSWFGVGRDDGDKAGEFMAIFYLRERFKLLEEDTFWLSPHPDSPGPGWDAAYNRVVTWGRLEDRLTRRTFYHFNTHFDNRGEQARQESTRLLLKQIESIAGNNPVVVTGDFNAHPDSQPYAILTAGGELLDTKSMSKTAHHGPSRTFNGFDLESLMSVDQPIDYIFVNSQFQVLKHATLSDTFDGYFPSDHMPVLVQLKWKAAP